MDISIRRTAEAHSRSPAATKLLIPSSSFLCPTRLHACDLRNRIVQVRHSGSNSLAVCKNRRTGDEYAGSGCRCWRSSFQIDTSVHLHFAAGINTVDHSTYPPDFGQDAFEEVLMPEAGVHRHYEHLIDLRQDFVEHSCRCGWVDHYPDTLTEFLDAAYGTIQVVVALPVDQKRIGAGLGKVFEKKIGIREHQVSFQRQPSDATERVYDRRPHRQIGNEMSVHDVDVNSVGTGILRLLDLLAQSGEVGGQNRGCQFDNLLHSIPRLRVYRPVFGFESLHKLLVAARDLLDRSDAADSVCTPVHQWLPEAGAAYREADEAGYSRGSGQPELHFVIVLAPSQDDAADFIPAILARRRHNPFTILAGIKSLDFPDVWLDTRGLQFLDRLNH